MRQIHVAPVSPIDGKLLYHVTHIENAPSIVTCGGLLSRAKLRQAQGEFQDIADPEIINGRENYRVALSQYVPFHFFAKNPFDWAVSGRFGAKNLIIVAIWRDFARTNGAFIIPSHPLNTDTPEFLPYAEGFQKVRWDLMDPDVRNYRERPETKQASMAECDLLDSVSIANFAMVYVYDEEAAQRLRQSVQGLFDADALLSKVKINSRMFPPLPEPRPYQPHT